PPSGRMFLRGIDLDPPRAGTMATVPASFTMRSRCESGEPRPCEGLLRGPRHLERRAAVRERAERLLFPSQTRQEMPHLVEEHPYAFEALRCEPRFPLPGVGAVAVGGRIRLVPRNRARGSDHCQLMVRGPLDEVEMDVGGGAAREPRRYVDARVDRKPEG